MTVLLLLVVLALGIVIGGLLMALSMYLAINSPETLGQILGKWLRLWGEKTETDSLYVYDIDQKVTCVRISTLVEAVEHEVPRRIHLTRTRAEQHRPN